MNKEMKAKVKETGEWVTVNPCYDGFYDVNTHDIYVPDDLDFATEFNWQSFRREVAKDILPAMINWRRTNEAGANLLISKEEAVKLAIEYANELIKQLKQE